jgi:hypothetical protein
MKVSLKTLRVVAGLVQYYPSKISLQKIVEASRAQTKAIVEGSIRWYDLFGVFKIQCKSALNKPIGVIAQPWECESKYLRVFIVKVVEADRWSRSLKDVVSDWHFRASLSTKPEDFVWSLRGQKQIWRSLLFRWCRWLFSLDTARFIFFDYLRSWQSPLEDFLVRPIKWYRIKFDPHQ